MKKKNKITRSAIEAAHKTISQIIFPALSFDDAKLLLVAVVLIYLNHFIAAMKTREKEKDPD